MRRYLQCIARYARSLAAAAASDSSTASLLLANLLAVAIALLYGISQAIRILCLKGFSRAGLTDPNGRPLDAPGVGKIGSAIIFAAGYGVVHLALLIYIVNDLSGGKIPPLEELLLCGLAFAAHQVYSTARKIGLDRRGRPRIFDMMGEPFTRIWPMHAVFIVGGLFARDSVAPWWLFVGLKAVVDVAMHSREERALREADRPAASDPAEGAAGG